MEQVPAGAWCDGLEVRCSTPHDVAVLAAAIQASLEHLRPWMPWIAHEPLTPEARRDLIVSWEVARTQGGDATYGIFEAGRLVGGTGLHRRIGPGGLEVGYWVHVDHVGRGIATRAAIGLTEVAFTMGDIDRVEIHHDLANEASARVPARIPGYGRVEDVVVDVDLAPAETGVRAVWRTTRAQWRSAHPVAPSTVAGSGSGARR